MVKYGVSRSRQSSSVSSDQSRTKLRSLLRRDFLNRRGCRQEIPKGGGGGKTRGPGRLTVTIEGQGWPEIRLERSRDGVVTTKKSESFLHYCNNERGLKFRSKIRVMRASMQVRWAGLETPGGLMAIRCYLHT